MLTKVLLVDDHPAMLLALKTLFTNQVPFDILGFAHDGESCFSLTKNLNPDMIVLDLDLPNTDGFDLIRRIKSYSPNIRILILTSLEERVYGNRVRLLGAHGFVNKSSSGKIIIAGAIAVSQGYSFFTTAYIEKDKNTDTVKMEGLSQREFQIMKMLGLGCSNFEIAEHLHISNKTVATYKKRIFEKIEVSNIADLVHFCRRNNLSDK
jgi:two-component system response regulator FimZ (fimbrial Z protein)/two-component system response regulator EvgA